MYPTDLTDARWQIIKKTLHLDDRKRKHSLRLIWNALFYLVKTGCQWRMLPVNFPKWQLVYYYYKKWVNMEQFDLLLDHLRSKERIKRGQTSQPTLGIIDSQTVRWGNNRSFNGIDGNKKVKGIKRHVVVDKNGFLMAVMVTVANTHDSSALMLLMKVLKDVICGIMHLIADGGYRGQVIQKVKQKFGYTIQVVLRTDNDNKEFKPVHKRWIVERTFAWFDNDRRLCRNYELIMESAEEMVKLSAIKLLINKF